MAEGKNMSAVHKDAAAGTLVRTAIDAPPADPVQDAYSTSKQVLGTKMLQAQINKIDADAATADVEKMKAENEREKLKAERQPQGPSQSDTVLAFLMARMEQTEASLAQARAQADAERQARLEQTLLTLKEEREELRATIAQQTPNNPMMAAVDTLEQAKKLVETVTPQVPQVDPTPSSAHVAAIQFEIEKFRILAEQAAERERRQDAKESREWQLKYDLELKKLEREEARADSQAQSMDRFMTQQLPQILPLVKDFMGVVVTGMGQAAPAAAGMQVQIKEAPAGAKALECNNCGSTIHYREGAEKVLCQVCGAVYTENGQEAPRAPAPNGHANGGNAFAAVPSRSPYSDLGIPELDDLGNATS